LGEEENFEVFDAAGSGVEAGNYFVAEFFGFLGRVGWAGVDVEDVANFVIAQR
jgi:hypothetical protein